MESQSRKFKLPAAEWHLITADLNQARRFLWLLQKVDNADYDSTTIRTALTLAAIVTYCRPFKLSYDERTQKRKWMPGELVDDLPSDLKTLHAELLDSRDKAWAHTDWRAHTPNVSEGDGCFAIVSLNPWVSLSSERIRLFLKLIFEVDTRLEIAVDASKGVKRSLPLADSWPPPQE